MNSETGQLKQLFTLPQLSLKLILSGQDWHHKRAVPRCLALMATAFSSGHVLGVLSVLRVSNVRHRSGCRVLQALLFALSIWSSGEHVLLMLPRTLSSAHSVNCSAFQTRPRTWGIAMCLVRPHMALRLAMSPRQATTPHPALKL